MSDYKENIVYKGNIIRYINNVKESDPVKTTYLIYSEKEDCFIDLMEALNPSFDLLNPNIKDKKEIENKINKHKYPYKRNGVNNITIVDEESLKIIAENKKKGR